MMKITGLSHLFKWENLHNWWLTKYFFAPLYMVYGKASRYNKYNLDILFSKLYVFFFVHARIEQQ